MSKLYNFDLSNRTAKFLIGTDEAGRGSLAGPVVAAAVCFPEFTRELMIKLELVNDSKKLTEKNREFLYDLIIENSINAIVVVSVDEIEKINILQASLKGMRLACDKIISQIGEDIEIFIDGNKNIPNYLYKTTTIVKGDAKSFSIAAASILAKVYRDRLMLEYSNIYPEYDFAHNKGYGTPKHIEAIMTYGILPIHRKKFLTKILETENNKQLVIDFDI